MNAASAMSTYARMQSKILQDDEAVCMLVEVIATRTMNDKWVQAGLSHKNIRRVSIDQFYELVFGDKDAFFRLCKALPIVLEDVLTEQANHSIENSVYHELEELSPDIMRSLYKLAFKTYEGFDKF